METTALTVAKRDYVCKADRPRDVRDRVIARLVARDADWREATRQLRNLVGNLADDNTRLRSALARRDAAIGRRRPRRIE